MATTITDIRSALESVVTGLSPTGTAWGRDAYTIASNFRIGDDRPRVDMDREVIIGAIQPGSANTVGSTSDVLLTTMLDVEVWHMMGGDVTVGEGRRDQDLEQLVREFEDPANLPSDVCAITYSDTDVLELDKHWHSTISFDMTYLGSH